MPLNPVHMCPLITCVLHDKKSMGQGVSSAFPLEAELQDIFLSAYLYFSEIPAMPTDVIHGIGRAEVVARSRIPYSNSCPVHPRLIL